MKSRNTALAFALILAFLLSGCHKNKSQNPIANIDSKQPDKVLFDRAMDAMKRNKFDMARLSLQTLINSYPDSEYIARAKLGMADAWYNEGGSSALAQAEAEYKDFETFFPNMPEAAEAQLKVANIHYRQMEKPDRDYTHAKRAEDEYRALINMYPDSRLIPEAKARLLEVQEVLAEREFRIGHFYYSRESFPAAIARLQSLADQYPLYSGADETLFTLGQCFEREKGIIEGAKADEAIKAKLIKEYADKAADAYSRIVTKYPLDERAGDAKERLKALYRQVPTPTPEDLAFNKQVQESRGSLSRYQKLRSVLRHGPDTEIASKVGEPILVDAKQTSAPDVVRELVGNTIKAAADVEAEKNKTGAPVTNNSSGNTSTTGVEIIQMKPGDGTAPPRSDSVSKPPPSSTDTGSAPLPPPAQVNDANTPDPNAPATATDKDKAAADKKAADDKAKKDEESTSKKKKKSFFRRIIPGGGN